MFDIHGDEIFYFGIPFATINGRAWPTMRAKAESELIHGLDGWITQEEADEQAQIDYERGENSGREESDAERAKCITYLEDAISIIEFAFGC